MEVERLVEELRSFLRKYAPIDIADIYERRHVKRMISGPVYVNRHRAVATVAKMLVEDKTITDGERLAGVLMQMMGAGGAKPYEVCDE